LIQSNYLLILLLITRYYKVFENAVVVMDVIPCSGPCP